MPLQREIGICISIYITGDGLGINGIEDIGSKTKEEISKRFEIFPWMYVGETSPRVCKQSSMEAIGGNKLLENK